MVLVFAAHLGEFGYLCHSSGAWIVCDRDTAKLSDDGTMLHLMPTPLCKFPSGQFLRVVRPYFGCQSTHFTQLQAGRAYSRYRAPHGYRTIGHWSMDRHVNSPADCPDATALRLAKAEAGAPIKRLAAALMATPLEVMWEEIYAALMPWIVGLRLRLWLLLTENPRVERLSSDDIPGMPTAKSLLPASLPAIRTAGQKIIRALRKRAFAQPSSSTPAPPPVVKPNVSPRLAPSAAEPPLKRRRLPHKTAAPSAPEQVAPAPSALPVPASPAIGSPRSRARSLRQLPSRRNRSRQLRRPVLCCLRGTGSSMMRLMAARVS